MRDALHDGRLRSATRTLSTLSIAIGLALGAGGCGAHASQTPEHVVADFAEALRDEDYRAAYALLSAERRAEISFERFRDDLERHPDERREVAELLAHTGEARVRAVVPYGEGERLELVYEDGAFRLVGNVYDLYAQDSPRSALRTFVRAIERGRYDVLLKLVPNGVREGMTEASLEETMTGPAREEVARVVANLRAGLHNPITVRGEHALMPYGDRFTAELIFEDGVWKVDDPE